MTKVVIGHCYTDENKGDAGIVIATLSLIRRISGAGRVVALSTFGSRDDAFQHHHESFKGAGAEMIPALLPEDKLFVLGRTFEGAVAKTASFVKNVYLLLQGLLLFRINPTWAVGDVGKTLRALSQHDLFLSKGGSFLYNEGGLRGDLSLFKLLVPFWVAKKLGLRTIILAQSLGPFNSPLSRAMFRHSLRSIDRIYLREDRCLRYLAYLDSTEYGGKIDQCPDLAFALSSEGFASVVDTDDGLDHIGMTIVNHRFRSSEAKLAYVDVLVRSIGFLSERFPGAVVHIFPQVLSRHVGGRVDLELSREVVTAVKDRLGIEVDLQQSDFDARALKETYRLMRFFIATRLHSSIFATSVGTPTIVFGYHGTKAEGIWNDLGFGDLFFDIDELTWPSVEQALVRTVHDLAGVSRRLLERTSEWRDRIEEVIRNELA